MDIEIYCDESNQQLLSSATPTQNRFFLIGGVWLPAEKRTEFKNSINHIKHTENCFGESKWTAVCPSKLSYYLKLIDFFFAQEDSLRFRCIVIDAAKVELEKYHHADQELGYYKFCYQLLKNWIEDFNSYCIYLDCKTNRIPNRLQTLQRFLDDGNLLADVLNVQALPSKEVVIMQLADVLLGAVSAKFNNSVTSEAKMAAIQRIEYHLNHKIRPTPRTVKKFNVFKIDLLS
ncbi:MAG: DUF3800 domain-containing protein [bacterium]|nr:DUF3800 domain-containing protein [bacterium]